VDDVDLGIREERIQIGGALLRRAGDEVVPRVDARCEPDAVALLLPPLDAAEKVGAVLPRARGRRNSDGPAVGERAGEKGGRFQGVESTCLTSA
jgi:hypothetical protein